MHEPTDRASMQSSPSTRAAAQISGGLLSFVCCPSCWLLAVSPCVLCLLPSLSSSSAGTFDLLIYTPQDLDTPAQWEESDPKYIQKSNEVKLRSFTTKIHKIETSVAYRADDE